MSAMAVTAKKLDIKIGDLVEVEGRKYDVVSDKQEGIALESAITKTVAEIHAEHGTRAMTPEEFEHYFGDLPSDGEG
jgi:NMD protein affecting ribosome stability and mRNA decay